METLRALMCGDLSPAGNKISLDREPQAFGYHIEGYSAHWVDSGTSALALALMNVKAKSPQVKFPKVIIPGYCCPDLVAAAIYAGVKPLIVDICADDASYDLDALQEVISDENILAIIAVNFLGIKERLPQLQALLNNTSIKIIEDNAQWFPVAQQEHQFVGDYVLFSLGRGKPLSLLGGGVLYAREPIIVAGQITPAPESNAVSQRLKTHLYNVLLHPHFYCYLNRAPFLHLGETHYHAHHEIVGLGALSKELFAANRERYERRGNAIENSYDGLFAECNLQSLTSVQTERRMRLLRYPLVCKTTRERDVFLAALGRQGLGASPLYQRAIIEIPQVSGLVEVHGDLKNAQSFAARLLTLPTHEQVTAKHLARMKDIFTARA